MLTLPQVPNVEGSVALDRVSSGPGGLSGRQPAGGFDF